MIASGAGIAIALLVASMWCCGLMHSIAWKSSNADGKREAICIGVLFALVVFLCPILLVGLAIPAYLQCAADDISSAHWAFPIAGCLAFCAFVVQGHCVAWTFAFSSPDEVNERGTLYFGRGCLIVALYLSLLTSAAFIVPNQLHVSPSHEEGFSPFSGGSWLFFSFLDDHSLPPPPEPPSPPMPPWVPSPLSTTPNLNQTLATEPASFNALQVFLMLFISSKDIPMPSESIGTMTLVGVSSICMFFGLVLWYKLGGPMEWWKQFQKAYSDASGTDDEECCVCAACCPCSCGQLVRRWYLKLMAPFTNQHKIVLVYHAVVAAFDFTFDIAYVLTQDFALFVWEPFNVPLLWLLSLVLCILPSLIFFCYSGMLQAWGKYAKGLIEDEFNLLFKFSRGIYDTNVAAAKRNSGIVSSLFSWGVATAKAGMEYDNEQKRNQCEGPWDFGFICVRKVLIFASILAGGAVFAVFFLFVLATFILSCIICGIIVWLVFTFVLCPAYFLLVVVVWPTGGLLWCVIHINFKLSILPGATVRLYKFMRADSKEHPVTAYEHGRDPRFVHFHINLSFLSEVAGESAPQLVVCVLNEMLLAARKNRQYSPSSLGWAQLVGSVFAILTNVWPHVYWRYKFGACFGAYGSLKTIILPLDQQQADIRKEIKLKARTLKKAAFRDQKAWDDFWEEEYRQRPPPVLVGTPPKRKGGGWWGTPKSDSSSSSDEACQSV